ncbi:MAG: ABC transporter substrate-binding protein [Algicola sp.]|nr:ABC transporter substrate-binding protein [Algicola sp.]
MQVKDQLQRTLVFSKPPRRIVSLVPSLTELICDLGLKQSLVGVTKFCVHPESIRTQADVVGGTKQVHFNKIKALQPDVILCNKEENTKALVEGCAEIAPVHVSDLNNLDDCLELIGMYGDLFEVKPKALKLVGAIEEANRNFKTFIKNKASLKVAYFIWKDPWMVAAQNTFVDCLLKLNGFENVFANLERYPEIALDDIELKEADLILLSSEPYPFKTAHKMALEKQFPKTKVLLVDGEMFSWYGSRLLYAFDYFRHLHKHGLH